MHSLIERLRKTMRPSRELCNEAADRLDELEGVDLNLQATERLLRINEALLEKCRARNKLLNAQFPLGVHDD